MRSRNFFTLRMLALNWQHIQRSLQLAPGVLVARTPRHLYALLIKRPRLFNVAQLFQHLPTMKIAGCIIRIVFQ